MDYNKIVWDTNLYAGLLALTGYRLTHTAERPELLL